MWTSTGRRALVKATCILLRRHVIIYCLVQHSLKKTWFKHDIFFRTVIFHGTTPVLFNKKTGKYHFCTTTIPDGWIIRSKAWELFGCMFTGILGWVGGCDLKHGQYRYIYIFTQRSVSDLNILYIYIFILNIFYITTPIVYWMDISIVHTTILNTIYTNYGNSRLQKCHPNRIEKGNWPSSTLAFNMKHFTRFFFKQKLRGFPSPPRNTSKPTPQWQ